MNVPIRSHARCYPRVDVGIDPYGILSGGCGIGVASSVFHRYAMKSTFPHRGRLSSYRLVEYGTPLIRRLRRHLPPQGKASAHKKIRPCGRIGMSYSQTHSQTYSQPYSQTHSQHLPCYPLKAAAFYRHGLGRGLEEAAVIDLLHRLLGRRDCVGFGVPAGVDRGGAYRL